MEKLVKKKERTRCTVCKRKRRDAISEQLKKKEPCKHTLCELAQEITEAIEESYKLQIFPKAKKIISITKKIKASR